MGEDPRGGNIPTDLHGADDQILALIVPPQMLADGIDPETTSEVDVRALRDSMPEPHPGPRVVSDKVNYVRNNRPGLIEPAD